MKLEANKANKANKAKKLIAVIGPTASGKTALACYLASVYEGEVVSADSRQIYRDLDVGTAKPTPERIRKVRLKETNLWVTVYMVQGVPHYLFDVITPKDEFSVTQYKELALQVIADILKQRGKLPFLVGGTGFYIKAVIDNLEPPEVPPHIELRNELEREDALTLYSKLKNIDFETAQVIDPFNKRRLIRALEVVLTTGKPLWQQQRRGPSLFEVLQIGIDIPKDILLSRVEERVNTMVEQGLEHEIEGLIKRYKWTNVLLSTIGYKEWKRYFERKKTREEVINEIIRNTKLLVKKQLTWFRAQKDIQWIKNKKEAAELVSNFLHLTNECAILVPNISPRRKGSFRFTHALNSL